MLLKFLELVQRFSPFFLITFHVQMRFLHVDVNELLSLFQWFAL